MRSSSALAPTGPLSLALCVEPELTRWNTVLYHLRTKFEPERLERVANTPCEGSRWCPRTGGGLRRPPPAAATVTKTTQTGLYHSVAKRGTTAFHAYATLYARVKNKRYTLAVRRLKDGDTASNVAR